MLNPKQQETLDLAIAGHNIFINGFAGTGKSFTIKEINNTLKCTGKNVAITCSTGIACTNYESACTLHRWSGINDGRYSSSEIIEKIRANPRIHERIQNTDVLIIDEISMISLQLFNQLICILTELKDTTKLYGGMQLIVAGDFYQLPPVPNKYYNDNGDFCFRSSYFKNLHRITLTDVVRQNQHELISVIREVSMGDQISQSTDTYIKGLARPLPVSDDSVKLFATHDQVNGYNRQCIQQHPGDIYEFKSTDSGQSQYLSEVTALPKLWLKLNCPVVLIRNLSNDLVNGLQGTIIGFTEDGPVVHFRNLLTLTVKRVPFTVFSPQDNQVLAERQQIPLLLCYAMTVHKSQGMTLDRAEIDCQQMFKAGQLGVAMGRVRTAAGLRVINFTRACCFPQPDEIRQYLQEPVCPPSEDLICCTEYLRKAVEGIGDDICWFGANIEDDTPQTLTDIDFDDEFNEIIRNLDMENPLDLSPLPENFEIMKILFQLKTEIPVTSIQEEINALVIYMSENEKSLQYCKEFCQQQVQELTSIFELLNISLRQPVKPDKWTELACAIRQYQLSDKFKIVCLMLFREFPSFTPAQSSICSNIFNCIKKIIIHEKVQLYSDSDRNIHQRSVTESSKSRIRYVAGYCVCTIRRKYQHIYRDSIYSASSHGQSQYQSSKYILSLVQALQSNEAELQAEVTDIPSLTDIKRRQYDNKTLTQVTNEVFELFLKICEKSLKLLTDKNVNIFGHNLYEHCVSELLSSMQLYEEFAVILNMTPAPMDFHKCMSEDDDHHVLNDIMSDIISKIECQKLLFEELIKKFLMVMLCQFRKDLLHSFTVQRSMEHRKQVLVSKKKSGTPETLSFQSIILDKSENKENSHTALKYLIINNVDVLKTMKREQLDKIAKAYHVTIKHNTRKAIVMDILQKEIVKLDKMPNSSMLAFSCS